MPKTEKTEKPKLTGRGGPGRGQGRKRTLIKPEPLKFYVSKATRKALRAIHPNRSKALRILTGTDV